jgi:hypothetical protein
MARPFAAPYPQTDVFLHHAFFWFPVGTPTVPSSGNAFAYRNDDPAVPGLPRFCSLWSWSGGVPIQGWKAFVLPGGAIGPMHATLVGNQKMSGNIACGDFHTVTVAGNPTADVTTATRSFSSIAAHDENSDQIWCEINFSIGTAPQTFVSQDVELQCYNNATEEWVTLDEHRFSGTNPTHYVHGWLAIYSFLSRTYADGNGVYSFRIRTVDGQLGATVRDSFGGNLA